MISIFRLYETSMISSDIVYQYFVPTGLTVVAKINLRELIDGNSNKGAALYSLRRTQAETPIFLRTQIASLEPAILLPSIQVARNKIREKSRHLFWLSNIPKNHDTSKRNSRPQL